MFDIVFIDGNHEYEYVKTDLKCAKELLRDNGIMCGDDLELQYDEIENDQPEMHKNTDVVFDNKNLTNYHPGVTLAVYEFFKTRISSKEGFWFARKNGNNWDNIKLSDRDSFEIPKHLRGKL